MSKETKTAGNKEARKIKLPIIKRERVENAIPLVDCTNRQIEPWLREDIIRYCLLCAEIQRDADNERLDWDCQSCKAEMLEEIEKHQLPDGDILILKSEWQQFKNKETEEKV